MGGTSKATQTQNQTATQNPWEPAVAPLKDVIGKIQGQMGNTDMTSYETEALDRMRAGAQAGNPFASQMTGVANEFLGGGPDYTGRVNDAYKQYADYLTPFARGDYLDPSSNPYYKQVSDDIAGRVNGMFAGAGRDFSGAHMQTLGRGIAEGVAPLYSQERERQLNAIGGLFSGANTSTGLLSNLSQTSLGNKQQGFGAAEAALAGQNYGPQQVLAAEAARRGIPVQNIGAIQGLLTPIAQLGGQATGTMDRSGTSTMSGAQQAWGWMNAISGLMGAAK